MHHPAARFYQRFLQGLLMLSAAAITYSTLPDLIIIGCGILSLILHRNRQALCTLLKEPITWATAAFIIIMSLHWLHPSTTLHATLTNFKRWLILLLILPAASLLQSKTARRYALNALLIGLTCQTLYAWLQQIAHYPLMQHPHQHYSNVQALAVGDALACTLFLYRSFQKKQSKPMHCFYALLFCIFLAAVLTQPERVGYFIICMTLPLVTYHRFGLLKMLGASCFLISVFVTFYTLQPGNPGRSFHYKISLLMDNLIPNAAHKKQAHDTSTGARMDGLRWGWANARLKPWWGYGIASFQARKELAHNLPTHYLPRPYRVTSIENSYMIIVLNLGLFGFIAFSTLIAYYARLACKHCNEAAFMLAALLLGGMTFPLWFTNMGMSFLCVNLSIILGALLEKKADPYRIAHTNSQAFRYT